ncbi:diguanylate cyclase domain-containing protein [Roseateles amylovorans]|uniref:Diguanylate cyclase n=1 Tax=Roseateles amylovorans TaxID=2978473 RepID=A0ABY6AZY5_9BURK|nr:diguanylate cyclase [Roseateles amylovorans]UXH78734.1 diguanylate cyclase [Roseateles amylovorans]
MSSRQPSSLWVPRVDSLTEFGLLISRQLTQCRRYGGHLAVLWLEACPLEHEGGRREQGCPEAAAAAAAAAGTARAPDANELMNAVGRRVRGRVRGTDMVLQVGENSFAVLLLDAGGFEAGLVQQRLMHALNGPYGVGDGVQHVGLQMGTAVFPDGGVRGADLAESARGDLRKRMSRAAANT